MAREADYDWCNYNPGPANTMERSTSGAHPAQLDDVGRGSQHVGCRGAGAGSKEAAGGSGGVVTPPHSAGMYVLFGFIFFGIFVAS